MRSILSWSRSAVFGSMRDEAFRTLTVAELMRVPTFYSSHLLSIFVCVIYSVYVEYIKSRTCLRVRAVSSKT